MNKMIIFQKKKKRRRKCDLCESYPSDNVYQSLSAQLVVLFSHQETNYYEALICNFRDKCPSLFDTASQKLGLLPFEFLKF